MKTLQEYFKEAQTAGKAIGHFNFSTADQLRAIAEAGHELAVPVMAATSEGEAEFIGRAQAVALVRSYQAQGYALFLNADHHKSFTSAQAAIDAGYDTVLLDGSKLGFDENVALTKQVIEYAHTVKPDMMIEGELGYLRGSSEVQESIAISSDDYTKPEQAQAFVEQTGVERLAIVFGNIHGIVTQQQERLDIGVLDQIRALLPELVLVLHGASGLPDQDIAQAIAHGISNVHINTELRVAYHDALAAELSHDPKETTPYKFLAPSYEAMKQLVIAKLSLFSGSSK